MRDGSNGAETNPLKTLYMNRACQTLNRLDLAREVTGSREVNRVKSRVSSTAKVAVGADNGGYES